MVFDDYRGKWSWKADTVDTITGDIYDRAIEATEEVGLTRLDRKDLSGLIKRLFYF
jgi:hypothetical protein